MSDPIKYIRHKNGLRTKMNIRKLLDPLSPWLSIFATLISIATFYFSFLYENKEIEMAVMDVKLCSNEMISADIAFSNTGTEPVLVSSISLATKEFKGNTAPSLLKDIHLLLSDINQHTLIHPGDIKVQTISSSLSKAPNKENFKVVMLISTTFENKNLFLKPFEIARIRKSNSFSITWTSEVLDIFDADNKQLEDQEHTKTKYQEHFANECT